MDSKVDKQIRRYLKRISTKATKADAYNSYHYDIDYGNGVTIHVRFSDHLRTQHSKDIIDIVKMNSDVYILSIKQLQYSVPAEHILENIKSLMVFAPELAKFVMSMAKANDKMSQRMVKLGTAVDNEKKKLRKQYSEAEGLIELYDEVDEKHKKATQEISRLNQVIAVKDNTILTLLKRISILEMHNSQVVSLIGKIKNTTDQAKHEILLANNLVKNE